MSIFLNFPNLMRINAIYFIGKNYEFIYNKKEIRKYLSGICFPNCHLISE